MKNKTFKFGIATTFLMCLSSLTALALMSKPVPVDSGIEVSTVDEFNERANIEKASLRKASSRTSLECSRIYTQVAYQGGYEYLRFAAAVKGDLESIVYSAKVNGADVQLDDKSVGTVYKSIIADGGNYYHNGKAVINDDLASTKDYYWACYTIRFASNSPYTNKGIEVTLNINNGECVKERTMSLDSAYDGYTLGNYFADSLSEDFALDFEYEPLTQGYLVDDKSTYEIIQGGCTDGKYIYYSMNCDDEGNTTHKNSVGYIVKYDIAQKKVIAKSELVGGAKGNHVNGLGNANLTYNPKDGMIYSIGGNRSANDVKGSNNTVLEKAVIVGCPDYRIDPSDLSVTKLGDGDIREEGLGFEFKVPVLGDYLSQYAGKTVKFDVENFEYNQRLDRWAVVYRIADSSGANLTDGYRRMFFYDKDFNLLKVEDGVTQCINVTAFPPSTSYTVQEMSSDNRYIYVDYTLYGTEQNTANRKHSKIRVFDWDGKELGSKTGITIDGNEKFATKTSATNIQNVVYLNGDLYVAAYQSSSGLHVCKVTYTNPYEITEKDDTSLSFGEKVDSLYGNDKTIKLTSSQVKTIHKEAMYTPIKDDPETEAVEKIYAYGTTGKTGVSTYQSFFVPKGTATDGENLYLCLNGQSGSNASSGYDIGVLVKTDTSGNVIKSSPNAYWWGNGCRVSYYDGSIIVSRTNAGATKDGNTGKYSSYTDTEKFDGNIMQFDAETLELISTNFDPQLDVPTGGVLDEISSSPDGRRVAAVYNYTEGGTTVRRLYTFNVESDGRKTLISGDDVKQGENVTSVAYDSSNNANLVSMQGTNDYLYLFYTNGYGGVIRVMDYKGNVIVSNKTIDTPAETNTHKDKNYQGLVEVKGALYYSIACWSSFTGWGLYKIAY